MTSRHVLILIVVSLAVTVGIHAPPASARQGEAIRVGREGRFHLGSQARVAGALLEPGMYQVEHVTEGADHVIVFREVTMGYRNNMGNQRLGKEVARVKCRTEPAGRKVKNTKLFLRLNAAGEKEASEVQVKGENVRHLL